MAAPLPDATPISDHVEAFGLASGPRQLRPFFDDVSVERFENHLEIPSAESVLAQHTVAARIRREGSFHVSTHPA